MTWTSSATSGWRAGVLLVVAGALTGCTGDGKDDDSPDPPPVALEKLWQEPGLDREPQTTGQHHWISQYVRRSGGGQGSTFVLGPLMINDARTGRQVPVADSKDGGACATSLALSPAGHVALQKEDPDGGCTRLVIVNPDGTVRRTERLTPDDFNDQRWLAVDDDVLVAVDRLRVPACFPLDGTATVPDERCTEIADRLTLDDLPDLTLPDGTPVPVAPTGLQPPDGHPDWDNLDPTRDAVGRSDGVLLVTEIDDSDERVFRAHDLRTGDTLWQTDGLGLEHERLSSGAVETYFVGESGIVHVTYRPADDRTTPSTRRALLLTAVDARTGKDGRTFAQVEDVVFHRAYGDVLVALARNAAEPTSDIVGYRLPTW